jgi:hypothetical protein
MEYCYDWLDLNFLHHPITFPDCARLHMVTQVPCSCSVICLFDIICNIMFVICINFAIHFAMSYTAERSFAKLKTYYFKLLVWLSVQLTGCLIYYPLIHLSFMCAHKMYPIMSSRDYCNRLVNKELLLSYRNQRCASSEQSTLFTVINL